MQGRYSLIVTFRRTLIKLQYLEAGLYGTHKQLRERDHRTKATAIMACQVVGSCVFSSHDDSSPFVYEHFG